MVPAISVWPSGSALSSSRKPISPLAPDLFSTTTGWPNLARRPSPTNRAERSVMPAGGAGTIIRSGREGKDCANAEAASSRQKARLNSARMVFRTLFRPQIDAHSLVHKLQRVGLIKRNRRLDQARAHHFVEKILHARVGHGADAERGRIAGIDDPVLLHFRNRIGQQFVGHF